MVVHVIENTGAYSPCSHCSQHRHMHTQTLSFNVISKPDKLGQTSFILKIKTKCIASEPLGVISVKWDERYPDHRAVLGVNCDYSYVSTWLGETYFCLRDHTTFSSRNILVIQTSAVRNKKTFK